ncbi:MAG: helix-turn-helix domain-containing protein, partial [Singulisphaera sp.]
NASYRLTEKGKHHIRPARPDIPDEQLQAQEAFILLQVFRAKERKLTRSDLNAKLKSRAAMGQLEFDVKEAPATVDYHLTALVEKGCLDEQRRGVSVGYSLNPERGAKALASVKQHDGVSFTMNGETLNALLAAARQAKPIQSRLEESPLADEPAASLGPDVQAARAARHREVCGSSPADKYAGKDLIPIHEVRRLVAEHHGNEAAGHPAFDPLIKRMEVRTARTDRDRRQPGARRGNSSMTRSRG